MFKEVDTKDWVGRLGNSKNPSEYAPQSEVERYGVFTKGGDRCAIRGTEI